MIAGAKQSALSPVPDNKCKIAQQVLQTLLAPPVICAQYQFDIRRVIKIGRCQFADQFFPAINPGIGGNPASSARR